jgi:threonine dehydratase
MDLLSLCPIYAARRAIAGIADGTPLIPSPYLSKLAGAEVLLKLETMQATGAFKLRGAVNAVSRLPDGVAGVTCCSTGNHGRAVAHAAKKRRLRAVVCMSKLVPKNKVDAIRALGAEVRIVGDSQDDAQQESARLAREDGLAEVPPFDHPDVIAGQGTIALELFEARPDIATILVPLSGGGLAAGVAFAAKRLNPATRVIGISMDRGAAMHASLAAGRPVEVGEVASLADSLGGGIGLDNRLSFALCRDNLDRTMLVSEAEIYRGMQALYYEDRVVAEGASAVGAAALLSGRLGTVEGPVVLLVTGRNVDMAMFTDIVTGRDVRLGDMTLPGKSYAA